MCKRARRDRPGGRVPLLNATVFTLYHDFRRERAGRHVLKLCRAEACQAAMHSPRAEAEFGIALGNTTADDRVMTRPGLTSPSTSGNSGTRDAKGDLCPIWTPAAAGDPFVRDALETLKQAA